MQTNITIDGSVYEATIHVVSQDLFSPKMLIGKDILGYAEISISPHEITIKKFETETLASMEMLETDQDEIDLSYIITSRMPAYKNNNI